MEQSKEKRVVIVGGGFGGVATALRLAKKNNQDTKIILVSNKRHFEYTPALHRVVTGRSPLQVCIPMSEILGKMNIEFVEDSIIEVDIGGQVVVGESGTRYQYDYLVLSLGSQTAYFDISGLKKFSFGFKSICEALRLNTHIHSVFKECVKEECTEEEKLRLLHFVIVGAGATGTELAGDLSQYTRELARVHGVDPSFITIDLFDGAPRILPTFPENVAKRVSRRLRRLGVHFFPHRLMAEAEAEEATLRGMNTQTETIIWTAGVKPNQLYSRVRGLSLDKDGRVRVDPYLRARGSSNVFVVGDGAQTKYNGMAQTALDNGKAAADNINLLLNSREPKEYKPKKPYLSLPVGRGWAATMLGFMNLYGRAGWILRRAADLRYFLSILPFSKAITAFRKGGVISKVCPTCALEMD